MRVSGGSEDQLIGHQSSASADPPSSPGHAPQSCLGTPPPLSYLCSPGVHPTSKASPSQLVHYLPPQLWGRSRGHPFPGKADEAPGDLCCWECLGKTLFPNQSREVSPRAVAANLLLLGAVGMKGEGRGEEEKIAGLGERVSP